MCLVKGLVNMSSENKELLSLMVAEGNRKYEFAVLENGGSSRYIVITASKKDDDGAASDVHKIIIPEENLQAFYHTFLAVRRYMGYGSKSDEGKPPKGTNRNGSKAGSPWSEEEDAQLRSEFEQGLAPDAIAPKHQRSGYAIRMRLEKLGLISSEWKDRLPQASSFGGARK
jgi:hypothetical protein